jgi:predicted enzyme related to lactoylglutathione lyase
MTTGIRKAGDFCWINILTPQPAAARVFFGKLLGWTYSDMSGMGNLIEVGDKKIGGLFDIDSPQTPKGTPPVIGVMVMVDDADEMVAKVKSLGGDSKPPQDITNNGRMVMCTDPNGANIDLWQARAQHAGDADTSQHGVPSWFENYTTDVDRVTKFYDSLFGWTSEVMPMPGMNYTTFKLGDAPPIAGMMAITPEMGNMPSHWMTYFTVNDVDATLHEATDMGGSVFMPPHDVPDVGRFCGLVSPQGVRFMVIKYAPRRA